MKALSVFRQACDAAVDPAPVTRLSQAGGSEQLSGLAPVSPTLCTSDERSEEDRLGILEWSVARLLCSRIGASSVPLPYKKRVSNRASGESEPMSIKGVGDDLNEGREGRGGVLALDTIAGAGIVLGSFV